MLETVWVGKANYGETKLLTMKELRYTGFWVREKFYGGSIFSPAYKVVRSDGSSSVEVERDAIGRIILYQKINARRRNNNSYNFSLLDFRLDVAGRI